MPKTTVTPEQAIESLMDISPCPVVHSTVELPISDPLYARHKRSCYARRLTGKWNRPQDYIIMNTGESRHWKYVTILAHEIGHALDYNGIHPVQHLLKSPRCRYRNELAAVSFQISFNQAIGLSRMKRGKAWNKRAVRYLNRYKTGNHPNLATIINELSTTDLAGLI